MKPATTITKVCRVLSEFRERPGMGVSELARRLDLLPSDVHRILQSLAAHGFVEQNERTKMYRLGVSVVRLGLNALQRNELRDAARPLLLRLSEQMDASSHMVVFDSRELEIFLAEQIDHPAEQLFKSRYGGLTNGHSSALGKAILANIDPALTERFLARTGLPVLTPHTIRDGAALRGEFALVARQGYAVDREESAGGACCIGAPVRDRTGSVVAAVSVSMAASRFYRAEESELALPVKAAAEALSALTR